MNDKTFNELKDLILLIKENNKYQIEEISELVEDIIRYKIIDENTIEHTFDRMLSIEFIDEEDIKKIYYRLLKYYKKINKKASEDYKELFIEKFNNIDDE